MIYGIHYEVGCALDHIGFTVSDWAGDRQITSPHPGTLLVWDQAQFVGHVRSNQLFLYLP